MKDYIGPWDWVPLPNVVDYQEGPGVRKHQYTASGVKLLNGSNINNNTLDLNNTERYVSEKEAHGKYSHFLVDEGDLLIASSGIAVDKFHTKIAFAKAKHLPLCMNTSTIRFKAKTGELNINYFKRFLGTNLFKKQLGRLITGSAQLNFGPSHLKQMKIPLPPLKEQRRIAAILDKADAIHRKRQRAIELTETFLRSVFLDMFGDPVTNPKDFKIGRIGDLLLEAKYGTSKKAGAKGKYPILRMSNITYSGDMDIRNLKYVDLNAAEEEKYLAKYGDILFNRTNSKELVGKTAVYTLELPMAIAGYLVRGRTNDLGNPFYISGFMNSVFGKTLLRGMCKSIVGMANINAKEFQSIKIMLPPISLQKEYADIVIKTHSRVHLLESESNSIDILFNSLSQKAFKGELTQSTTLFEEAISA